MNILYILTFGKKVLVLEDVIDGNDSGNCATRLTEKPYPITRKLIMQQIHK